MDSSPPPEAILTCPGSASTQLDNPSNPELILTRPFLDFSYALCEARSNRNFLKHFSALLKTLNCLDLARQL